MQSPLRDAQADVAIDNSKRDNGYLKTALTNNEDAFKIKNIASLGKLAGKKLLNAIICHGGAGVLHVGSGTGPAAANQLITLNNVATAGFNELGDSTSIWIYACDAGAGEDGAKLLFEIAKAAKCDVLAPNGLIYIQPNGQFMLQENAKWRTATPNGPPTDDSYPPLPTGAAPSLPSGGVNEDRHPWGKVAKVSYSRRQLPTVPGPRRVRQKLMPTPISGEEARSMVAALGLVRYQIKGAPGALHTGDLEFEFETDPTKYSFRVLNDRLIEDLQTGLFYFTSERVSRVIDGSKPASN